MTIDHARLTALFTEAMDLDGDQQRALIERVRATDPELANELGEMLAADDQIVTGLRTAGLKPTDVGAAFRRRTAVPLERVEIPGYQITGKLGAGGMGTVYAAEDATRRPVAIKVLEVAAPEALARFHAEAAIMQKLEHPNIARVLAAGDARSRPYIVMEQIDGVTLDVYAADHAAVRDRLALFAQICDTVEHAHRCGVIHRDLKPANIMVRRDGEISIVDFGVARAPESRGRTMKGDLIGTPLYMSPEQATGRSAEVDARSDVYSLGMILFELIAGKPPYDVRGKSLPLAVQTILSTPPARLDDPALDALCRRALAKAPADRFASAAELAAAIRAYASDL